ncbi:MAG: MotA/TolQ/ExbB proton channel family protein [Pseudomonadales bacterium]
MLDVADYVTAFAGFMEAGGFVLWLIALLVFVMWCLIIERIVYFRLHHVEFLQRMISRWQDRVDKGSWYAQRIREGLLSRGKQSVEHNLVLIKALIMLCPLLGLLGTVTGMIEVFDVLAVSGNGDVKSIAGGISRATIPTMAGMVAALSGVFAMSWLSRKCEHEKGLMVDRLVIEHA